MGSNLRRWTAEEERDLLACADMTEATRRFPERSYSALRTKLHTLRADRARREPGVAASELQAREGCRAALCDDSDCSAHREGYGHVHVPSSRERPWPEEFGPVQRARMDESENGAYTETDMVPRALYQKALRDRDAAKQKISEYVAALRSSVFEAVEEIVVHPPRQRTIRTASGPRTEEVAVLMAGDWQLGATRPTYNTEIAEQRIQRLAEVVVRLAGIQNHDHPVRKLHLQLLGDMVEGEGIFPAQSHAVDSGLYRQLVNGQRILSNLILDLLNYFDSIHVTGVIGNHGQVRLASGTSDPETNMDRLLYQTVRAILDGPARRPNDELRSRVTWDIPDGAGERNFFAVDRVFDWGFLLAHGDQIRGGFAGFPFYGAAKKAWGWIDSIDEPWDYLHFGHWHTPTSLTLNRRIARCNGSTESSNTYAQEQLAAVGYPTQWLGFVHPERGVTAEYWTRLGGNDFPLVPNSRRHRDYGEIIVDP